MGSSDLAGGTDLIWLECVYLCLFCVRELVYRCIYVLTTAELVSGVHIGD